MVGGSDQFLWAWGVSGVPEQDSWPVCVSIETGQGGLALTLVSVWERCSCAVWVVAASGSSLWV